MAKIDWNKLDYEKILDSMFLNEYAFKNTYSYLTEGEVLAIYVNKSNLTDVQKYKLLKELVKRIEKGELLN